MYQYFIEEDGCIKERVDFEVEGLLSIEEISERAALDYWNKSGRDLGVIRLVILNAEGFVHRFDADLSNMPHSSQITHWLVGG